ncbi:hypothetical protein ASPWEDRAFT_48203 [Aspergillus wentii DTO 134E9]|uniref:Mid2 domain-containing protein n=1 Tax=Aspergillus wentii DTO 134E9 TaxID=1073089 RepID=A0A1L9S3F0_ASPWE|nr:uncharacterized protein ASPWEDRAFT_48203 [Aspergillus wentii DTO 134E9]OJJ41680.1 hypothetical protein ASPWEDRAFT_48203 [Aspergillus wentii DTO 134E9]
MTTTTPPATTASTAESTITPIPLTTVFTPPASCSSHWTYEPSGYNLVGDGLLLQNAIANDPSCFPSGFSHVGRAQGTQVFSPGYCPGGYTSANVAIDGPTTTAICCISNFSYYTSIMMYKDLDSATYAGCISSLSSSSKTIVSARGTGTDEGTQVTGPITMWAQPITVQLQSTDSSLYVTSTATSSPAASVTASSATSTSTSTTTPEPPSQSQSPSSGLSAGAKTGIGVGVGVAGAAVFILLAIWLLQRRKNKRKVQPMPNAHLGQDWAPYGTKLGEPLSPAELEVYGARKDLPAPIHELGG